MMHKENQLPRNKQFYKLEFMRQLKNQQYTKHTDRREQQNIERATSG